MSDSIIPLRAKRFHEHPIVLQALAAVAARSGVRQIRASEQVESRVLYPSLLSSIDKGFFPASPLERADDLYEKTTQFLEEVQKSLSEENL